MKTDCLFWKKRFKVIVKILNSVLISNISSDYQTHPYYNMPIQGNPLSTGHLYGQSNFNQNYALMAQQQIATMHAAIQGNSHQIRRGFPNNFPATRFHYLRASNFNGGKLPFNIAPSWPPLQRPQQQQLHILNYKAV